jgi:hypothetical protein
VSLTASGRALKKQAPEVGNQIGRLFGLAPAELHQIKGALRGISQRMNQGSA